MNPDSQMTYRLLGAVYVAAGPACLVVAAIADEPVSIGPFLSAAGLFGATSYLLQVRRLRSVVDRAPEVPEAKLELAPVTRRGTVLWGLGLLVVLVGVAVLVILIDRRFISAFGGFMLGFGMSMFGVGIWIRRWENERNVHLQRDPRTRKLGVVRTASVSDPARSSERDPTA
jgi:hypothetical protein